MSEKIVIKKLPKSLRNTREGQIYQVWLLALAMSELVVDPVNFNWIEPIAMHKNEIIRACENELAHLGYKPTIKGLSKN
jgi:hypothetical protein